MSFLCNLALEAVSFYLMGLEFATSCWNLFGVSTGREVMRRLDSYTDKDAFLKLLLFKFSVYNNLLLEIIRYGRQTCTICSSGKHLVMLQTTRRICLCLRLDYGFRKIS